MGRQRFNRKATPRLPAFDQILESKMCEGKRGHLSMREAMAEARRLFEKSNEQVDAYQCSFCFLFHAGHRTSERNRKLHLRKIKERQDGYSVGWSD
jgi:hypothetical protein